MIASHIKPWRACEAVEKLDPDNGLLLCPNHDRLFDLGYISFDDDGKIIISDKISEVDRTYLNIREGMRIKAFSNNKYIKYHRDNVFNG